MEILEVHPYNFSLPKNFPFWRYPPRNKEFIDIEYINAFDFNTIFYDIFYSCVDNEVIAIGPPLLNLEECFSKFEFLSNNEKLTIDIDKKHKANIYRIKINSICDKIFVKYLFSGEKDKKYNFVIPIGKNYCNFFDGSNVFVFKNRNNRLKDILDIININISINKIDSVLLFDNNSDIYTANEIIMNIASRTNLKKFCLVHMPYKFGPQGGMSNITPDIGKILNLNIPWDSDYLEYSILLIAFYRFLKTANYVIQSDVDELFLPTNKSILDLLGSNSSVIYLKQIVIEFCNESEIINTGSSYFKLPLIRFDQSATVSNITKYAFLPRLISDDQQLATHYIHNNGDNHFSDDTLRYRHFYKINTSWKHDREKAISIDLNKHYLDCELIKNLAKYKFYGLNYDINCIIKFARKNGLCPRIKNINCSDYFDCKQCEYNMQ